MILLSDLRREFLGDLVIDGELTIVNTVTTDQLVVSNGNTGPAILINQTGTQSIAEFQDNGSTVLLVKGSRVGIGTNSPSSSLHVVGTARVDSLIVGSSSGVLHSSSGNITASAIVDADISTGAAIDWSKISKVSSSISDLGAPSTHYSLNEKRLIDLAEPLNLQDAATKNFVNTVLSSIALGSLSDTLVEGLSVGQLLISNSSGEWTNKSISGVVVIDENGTTTFSAGAITDESISNAASISLSKLESLENTKAVLTDANGVLSTGAVSATELSYLEGVSSPLQTQLDSKQPTGDYLTSLFGDVEGDGTGQTSISDETVTGKLLVGFTSSSGEVSASDTVLSAMEKLSGSAHNALTIGAANGLTLVGQQLSLATASASGTGALLVTDWIAFNDKEPAIEILPIGKGGTNNSNLDTSSGSIIYADGSKLTSLPLGSEGQLLTVTSEGLAWQDLPRASSYDDDTRPDASSVAVGSIIFNTDDMTLNVSDGTDWRDMVGLVT